MFSPRKWNVAMLTNVVFWHVVFAFETLICISGHSYHLPVVFYMMFQFFLTLKLHFYQKAIYDAWGGATGRRGTRGTVDNLLHCTF